MVTRVAAEAAAVSISELPVFIISTAGEAVFQLLQRGTLDTWGSEGQSGSTGALTFANFFFLFLQKTAKE